MTLTRILFELGEVSILPSAAEALKESGEDPRLFLDRHVMGDWGELSREDEATNTLALAIGGELHSSYRTSLGIALRIMTEADRSGTYVFLQEQTNGGEMEKREIESEAVFGSLTTAIGFALGELLLLTGRPEKLAACLAAIGTVAQATLLASDQGSEGTGTTTAGRSLASAAHNVVRAWHEEMDLTSLGDVIAELQDVLEALGVRYVPPRVIEE